MALQVGRLAFEVDTASVETFAWSRDVLQVRGWVTRAGNAAAAAAAAEVLNSYADSPDEPVVPVVWPEQAGVTGYYRVRGASLTGENGLAPQGFWGLSLDLERVRGFAAPLLEARVLGAQRAHSPAITAQYWHALPDSVTGYEMGATPTVLARACDPGTGTGGVTVFRHANLADANVEFYLPPADWYAGAPSLTVDGYLVAGRQVSNSRAWVLSNGIIRVSQNFTAGPVYTGGVKMERWTGSAWATVGVWRVLRNVTGTHYFMGPPHAITVLRNGPEETVIRLSSDAASMFSNGSRFVVNLDLSLRRGASVVTATLSTRGSYWWGYLSPLVYANLAGTGTASGYDSDTTNKFIMSVPETAGIASTGGLARVSDLSASTRRQWMWGVVPGTEAAADVARQWAAAQSERVQAVAR